MGLLLPVTGWKNVSSWEAHVNRGTPSQEPGTDFYVPSGTPVFAPESGTIYGYGTDISQPPGRWVGINLDNGMSFRCLHNSRLVRTVGRVERGDLIAYSGASGYGSEFFGEPYANAAFYANTGGFHSHCTLWPTWNHRYGYQPGVWPRKPYTIDIMNFVGSTADLGNTHLEDIMNSAQEAKLDTAVTAARNAESLAATVKQLLTETQQWKGIGMLVSETYQIVGVIKQVLLETEQWTGMDARLSQVSQLLAEIDKKLDGLKGE